MACSGWSSAKSLAWSSRLGQAGYPNNGTARSSPYYYFEDELGSSRIITQANGTVCYDADLYPFGMEQYVYTNTCPQNYKFTGKERDTETGLDYFGARYYAAFLGRFVTPDWAAKPTAIPYAKFGDPQTLNLYSYVENSPVDRADADGHEAGLCYGCGEGGTTLSPVDPQYPTPPATLEEAHRELSAVGTVPVVGDGANAIDGAIHLGQGHYGDAALSLAGFIPFGKALGKSGELIHAAEGMEMHHLLPVQFAAHFKAAK